MHGAPLFIYLQPVVDVDGAQLEASSSASNAVNCRAEASLCVMWQRSMLYICILTHRTGLLFHFVSPLVLPFPSDPLHLLRKLLHRPAHTNTSSSSHMHTRLSLQLPDLDPLHPLKPFGAAEEKVFETYTHPVCGKRRPARTHKQHTYCVILHHESGLWEASALLDLKQWEGYK